MLKTAVLVLAWSLGFAAPAMAQSPRDAQASVCRPEFTVGTDSYRAGTAFVLQTQSGALLVTAHHLFGPDGGGPATEVPWAQMPARARLDTCVQFAGEGRWSASAPIALEGARGGFDEASMLDVAAFPTDAAPALRLASRQPVVGDPVWLVAQTIGEPRSPGLLHRGVVAEVTDSYIYFLYDQPISITATSGAPIVNASGEVVGVNFGGGEMAGRYFGLGTGLGAVRRALEAR